MDKDKLGDIPSAPELDGETKENHREEPDLATNLSENSESAEPDEHWTEADEQGKQYDANRHDYVEHLNDKTPPPTPVAIPRAKHKRKWLLPIVIVLILVAAAVAYGLFGTKQAAAPTTSDTTSTKQQPLPKTTESTTIPKLTLKHYDSTNFAVGLDYPDTWKVNDTETLLSVVSPTQTFKTDSGKQVSGYIYITVQPKQTTLPEFAKGSATAALASEKVAYKSPTQNQRAQTYLTFASLATTTNNGWDALYITGDNGYQVGQDIPMNDIVQTDPLVTVRFLNCSSQACTGTTTPYSLQSSEWKNAAISTPIKAVLQSFSFD